MAELPKATDFFALLNARGEFLWWYNLHADYVGADLCKCKIWDMFVDATEFKQKWAECVQDETCSRVFVKLKDAYKSNPDGLLKIVLNPITLHGEIDVALIAREVPTVLDVLTPREMEVLGLLSQGASVQKISRKLRVSVSTVEKHRQAIRRKTGLDLYELMCVAVRMNI